MLNIITSVWQTVASGLFELSAAAAGIADCDMVTCAVQDLCQALACGHRIQQLMLSNTLVKLLAVFLFATPAVLVGGELYSLLQPDTSLWDGFLKIYSVLYIIPGWQASAFVQP